uniref:Uncharacterized protein n=1 Tax=Vitis vinifera TaxID=29760 RepID=A5APM3_VITVI|nr:hypothetical protein VITISV_019303 [Vitis vinifera]
MELLAIMNAMQTWRWERWQKVPTSSPTSGSPRYKTILTIFSRAIAKIEETPSDSPSEEVPGSESLDEEPESPLEVLRLLRPSTLETETKMIALHGARMN